MAESTREAHLHKSAIHLLQTLLRHTTTCVRPQVYTYNRHLSRCHTWGPPLVGFATPGLEAAAEDADLCEEVAGAAPLPPGPVPHHEKSSTQRKDRKKPQGP